MNGKFQVLTLEQEKEITDILARFPRSDIHYDPRYLRLFQDFNGQRAVYFYYEGSGGEFLLPFFERPLPDVGAGGQEKDLLSPWYYGGPLHNFADLSVAQSEFATFLQQLDAYCIEHGVISQFQRLNPALDNYELYKLVDGAEFNRKVVSIDLTKSLETLRGEYDYKVRKNLRRAREAGLRVVRGATPEAVRHFIKVYTASMERKAAGTFYYFNEKFYTDFFANFLEEAQLFTAYAGEKVAASSLVLGNDTILHDYLRAGYPQFMAMRPSDAVVDAIVEWAKGAGYGQYSLGGGHATTGEDSLFKFKKSFSATTKDFYIYRKVHNKDAYAKRCIAEGKTPTDLQYGKANPFPEYKTA